MKRYHILIMIFSLWTGYLYAAPAEASDWKTKYKETARSWLNKVVGEQKTNDWLGAPAEEITLPTIPEIVPDARSAATMVDHPEQTVALTDQEKEYNYRFLEELYMVVRGVRPTENDLRKWYNTLNQGGSREGIYRALVNDENYMGLENFARPVNGKMMAFTEEYLPRFLKMKIEKGILEKVNFYTLKKQVVEKSLEILDLLSSDRKKMADWYAVFSGEMAEKYPSAFQSEIRKDGSKKRHRDWAQKVPIQHLKSEVIVKLHLIYNSLEN